MTAIPLATLAEWHDYEARNRRANVEYLVRPLVMPLLEASVQRDGIGVTCRLFNVAPGMLVAEFPHLIERCSSASDGAA